MAEEVFTHTFKTGTAVAATLVALVPTTITAAQSPFTSTLHHSNSTVTESKFLEQ
jgi:hypothetical protein